MNYWETVAGQELLNLIRMEVSRYSARKQYTIKTKLQTSITLCSYWKNKLSKKRFGEILAFFYCIRFQTHY